MSELFAGVIIVALVGNAAEHYSAVTAARNDEMTLALEISIGSSAQIALMVAPVLVLMSYALGSPMSLVFNAFEIAAIGLSVLAVVLVSLDGESNWLEGLQLLGVYVILALAFYMVPGLNRQHATRRTQPRPFVSIATLQRVIRAPSARKLVGHLLDLIRTTARQTRLRSGGTSIAEMRRQRSFRTERTENASFSSTPCSGGAPDETLNYAMDDDPGDGRGARPARRRKRPVAINDAAENQSATARAAARTGAAQQDAAGAVTAGIRAAGAADSSAG